MGDEKPHRAVPSQTMVNLDGRIASSSEQSSTMWVPPAGIDRECVGLCSAMNLVSGIRTVESCCGHGREPYRIWFHAESLDALPDLLYWFAGCHCGHFGWRVIAGTDCARSPVDFMAEGPVGAYDEANDIARLIREDCCS